MSIRERKLKRENQRRWRATHPIGDAWSNHKSNAKKRGIMVTWSFSEFFEFCTSTGYHLLRSDGFVIHRDQDTGPYALDRVSCIPGEINRRLQDYYVDRWRKRCTI